MSESLRQLFYHLVVKHYPEQRQTPLLVMAAAVHVLQHY